MKKEKGTPKDSALRRRAEERLRGETGGIGPSPAEVDARRLVHELQVHQIELELQNTELKQAREELEQQLEKYSDLYNFAPVGYFTLDRDGAIREANLTGAKLLGIERSRMVGRRLESFLRHESRHVLDACLRGAYEGTAGEDCEVALLTPGDRPRYVQIKGAPVESDGDAVRQCRVVMIDITDRKQAEEKILRQTALVEGINRIFHEAITTDTEEKLGVVCLSVAEELTGSSIGFIGEIHADGQLHDTTMSDPGLNQCTMHDKTGHRRLPGPFKIHGLYGHVLEQGRSLLTNDPASHPESIGLPQGHSPLTAFLGVPLIESGKTIGLIAVGNREDGYSLEQQQILETLAPAIVQTLLRKRAEDEVRKSRDELELRVQERTQALLRQAELLELAHNAIIVRDMENNIIFWNRGAEEMYGWTRDEAKETSTRRLLKTKFPESRDETMTTLVREGKWEGELQQTTKDGRKITVLSRRAVQRDQDGNPAAIMEINLDITAARHAEEQLRQAQKMEAIGTLAGGIAHDFNNMLAAIIGNAELAMDDVPEEMAARHNLDQIFKAGMRARGLVRQILTFSRKTEHERKPMPLTPLVNETFKLLRSSLPTTIVMRLTVGTLSDVVLADPIQMQQILMNLCTNAAEAMRHTGGRLEVRLGHTVLGSLLPEEGMQPGAYVTLTVTDTGPGINEDVKSRIFEPFFTTKERGQGTGMGLAVVYGIVKSHQGVITVLSQPGQGATFTVYLPHYTSTKKVDEPTSRPAPKGKERILFVDDEEMLVEMAEGMLGHFGYSVTGTTDSMSALQTFAKDPGAFDLVLTDHTMPQMTGATLAQKLKELRPDIPVILCTGYSETISKEKAESMGIDGFVMKPLSRNELAETVRRVLDTKAEADFHITK